MRKLFKEYKFFYYEVNLEILKNILFQDHKISTKCIKQLIAFCDSRDFLYIFV